ncbi:Nramp family divalent metal transporter [candidate division KSB1 bacterium]
MSKKSILSRIGIYLVSVGPGIFLIGYNIGTGSVTSMASAGSRYGMSLFWTLLLSCLFSYFMFVAYGKFTIITGNTPLYGYKKFIKYGNFIAIVTLIGLVSVEITGLMGIFGIVADTISEWSKIYLSENGYNTVWIASILIVIFYLFLLSGKYSIFEKILILFVAIMGISFILSMFLVIPEPIEIIRGFKPRIPDDKNSSIIISSMVGTTLSAPGFLVRSILIQEKGWNINQIGQGKRDAFIAVSMMFILSLAIMACAAGTLYPRGIAVENVIDMVHTLEPIAGKFAISIFMVGVIGAGLSSIFPIILLAPWLICDYLGIKRNMKSKFFRIITGVTVLAGLIVPIFHVRPVFAMIASMALQIFMLPIVTITIIYLINKKDIMQKYKAGIAMNIGLCATFIFSLIMTYHGILGLSDYITGKI